MINIKELRIGNAVLCNGLRTIVNDSLMKSIIDNDIQWTIEPIPLKEVTLSENCNFTSRVGWDDQHYWFFEKDEDNPNRFELLETDNGFLLPSDEVCEFLHQLQNCYYFHSLKQELEINL